MRASLLSLFAVSLFAGCAAPPIPATKAFTAAQSSSTNGFAECLEGTTVVGGGFEIDEAVLKAGKRRTVVSSHPWANGWRVQCVDENSAATDGCRAFVLCATVLK